MTKHPQNLDQVLQEYPDDPVMALLELTSDDPEVMLRHCAYPTCFAWVWDRPGSLCLRCQNYTEKKE